jgi:hypothetical protein
MSLPRYGRASLTRSMYLSPDVIEPFLASCGGIEMSASSPSRLLVLPTELHNTPDEWHRDPTESGAAAL